MPAVVFWTCDPQWSITAALSIEDGTDYNLDMVGFDLTTDLDMAQFDVEATDEAIGRICTGQYMSLQEIRDFGTFPYAGYPWNEYLLEHFVANYSQKFMLLHIGFSANVCAGAIVKQASSFKDFNDLLVDILANSNIVLDEDSALEYLRQQGYIARRRYSDIGRIVTEAKVVRSKNG